jgi:UDP-N-acetyl-D-mannosaminuronate dehydrogenase
MQSELKNALMDVDAVILAVRHRQYRELSPRDILAMTGRPVAIVDCFGILDDDQIRQYFELGCEVKGLGRGHIQRIKEAVRRGGK